MSRRTIVAALAGGVATGWNVANVGAIALDLAVAYGVGLVTVGLFTTALFVTHTLVQIPGGAASDRFGARRVLVASLVIIAASNAVLLIAPDPALALAARFVLGIGTGAGFLSGSDCVRAAGGTPLVQGLFGGFGIGGAGLALAVVPQVEHTLDWRAPYVSALVGALFALLLLAFALREPLPKRLRHAHADDAAVLPSLLRDGRLVRLAVVFAASLGLSVVVGNWIVTLLSRESGVSKGTAGLVGALVLVLGVFTRPLGGWLAHQRPEWTRPMLGVAVVAGALGTAAIASAELALAVAGAIVIGLSAGLAFAPIFTAAARLRPHAPAAAVGYVNGCACLVVVAGTPLLGLTFSLGDGRLGFVVAAALWLSALALLPTRRELGVPN